MVQFGKRFESAQKGRWQRHNADYERLKLLLALATKAHERAPSTAHVSNYGDAGGGDIGLLAKSAGGDGGPPPGSLDASLSPTERQALATLWLKNRGGARPRVPRPASLNNLSLLGGAASPGAADDESWHWTRWLFSSKMPESYPLLVHGFDVALVATKGGFHCHLPTLSVFSDQIGIKKNASTLRETLRRDDHLGPKRMSL